MILVVVDALDRCRDVLYNVLDSMGIDEDLTHGPRVPSAMVSRQRLRVGSLPCNSV